MMIYYVANNTNDYGTYLHRCINAIPQDIAPANIYEIYDFVVKQELQEPEHSWTCPDLLLVDTNNTEIIIREKTELELVQDYRITKSIEIKDAHSCYLTLGFYPQLSNNSELLEFPIDCKQNDINNWSHTLQLYQLAGASDDTPVSIRDFNNSSQIIPFSLYKIMCLRVGEYYQYLYNVKWGLDSQIANAATLTSLKNITWPIVPNKHFRE